MKFSKNKIQMKNILHKQYLYFKEFGLKMIPVYSEIGIDSNGNCDFYGNQLVYPERMFKYSAELMNSPEILNQSCWDNADGIGLLIGQNNLRCLKIENAYPSDIQILLSELRLPLNYSWIIKGLYGDYYIIFKAKHFMLDFNLEKLVQERNDMSEFLSDKSKIYDISGLHFKIPRADNFSLNLIWKYSIIFLPPFKDVPYNLSFAFCQIPSTPPVFLPSRWLDQYFKSKIINGQKYVYTPEYYLDCYEERWILNENENFPSIDWKKIPYGRLNFEAAIDVDDILSNFETIRTTDYSYLYEVLFINLEYREDNPDNLTLSWIWKCFYTNDQRQSIFYFSNDSKVRESQFVALNTILKEVKILISYELDNVVSILNKEFRKFKLNQIENTSFDFSICLNETSFRLYNRKYPSLSEMYNYFFNEEIENQQNSDLKIGLIFDIFFKLFNKGISLVNDRNRANSPEIEDIEILLQEIIRIQDL